MASWCCPVHLHKLWIQKKIYILIKALLLSHDVEVQTDTYHNQLVHV